MILNINLFETENTKLYIGSAVYCADKYTIEVDCFRQVLLSINTIIID